jgi:hypothetical protein
VSVVIVLFCDGCGSRREPNNRGIRHARRKAAAVGWTHAPRGPDLCPACTKAHNAPPTLNAFAVANNGPGVCCWKCNPDFRRMLLCPTCGNKRCPRASDHALACTGSNEPGQAGSIYGGRPTTTDTPESP